MNQDPYSNPLKTIEGTFDGEAMWGNDQKIYPVPSNYASKSRLVEGDSLKLYLQRDGSFVFKQTKPIERRKLLGTITPQLDVVAEGGVYKVLRSAITYYKAAAGDEAVIILPAYGKPQWAALDNIIKVPYQDLEL